MKERKMKNKKNKKFFCEVRERRANGQNEIS